MKTPNYNLLKYEIHSLEDPIYEAYTLYIKMIETYQNCLEILYTWLESLTKEQLDGIMVSIDDDIDCSEEKNVGFMVRDGTGRRYIVYRETFRGIRSYYSYWILR